MPPRTFTEAQVRTAQRALAALKKLDAEQRVALAEMQRSLERLNRVLNAPTFNKSKAESAFQRLWDLLQDVVSKQARTADKQFKAMDDFIRE
jgi:hypothetical protein